MKKFVDLFWITFGESYEYTMAEIIAAKSAAIMNHVEYGIPYCIPYCIPCDHMYSTCGMHIECTSLFFRTSHFTWNAQRVTFLEIICFYYIFFLLTKKKHDKKKQTAKCECIPESVSAYFAWFARSDTRDGRVFFHRQHIILLIFILFITKKEIYTPHASHSTFNTTKIFNHISPTHLEPQYVHHQSRRKICFFASFLSLSAFCTSRIGIHTPDIIMASIPYGLVLT